MYLIIVLLSILSFYILPHISNVSCVIKSLYTALEVWSIFTEHHFLTSTITGVWSRTENFDNIQHEFWHNFTGDGQHSLTADLHLNILYILY